MALDLTPEQKAIGKANLHRVVGKLADPQAPGSGGVTRRQFMQGLIAAGATIPISAAVYFGYGSPNFGERPVKAGLIGAGDEGGVLVGEHNPRYLEFIACSDIRPSNQKRIFEDERQRNPASPRKGFKFHYGNDAVKKIRLYEDYHELLANPDIEAVVIALPLNLHAKVTMEALEAGKHVLCEKLMAWNIRQCKDMIRKQEQLKRERNLDLLLAIGHQRHYSMLYAHAVEVINSGVLGDIRHIRALWHRNNATPLIGPAGHVETDPETKMPRLRDSWRPEIKREDQALAEDLIRRAGFQSLRELVRWRLYQRTGGGLMAELGSHQLDACSIFLGKTRDHHVYPVAVTALGGKHFYQDDREIEDHVYCTYEFPGRNYDPKVSPYNAQGLTQHNDIVTVTYSSINTNGFEPYGECVMGSRGTLVVEGEQSAMLWGSGGRDTSVTVGTAGGRSVLDASATTAPAERRAVDTGQASMGLAPPSRGYREEMEHLAYCIRLRPQAMERDRDNLRPRCDGHAALDDAVMALVANRSMCEQKRIVFDPKWFQASDEAVPDLE